MGGNRAAESYAERRSRFERFFDAAGRRLVWVGAAADAEFWDRRWLEGEPVAYDVEPSRRGLVVRETTRLVEPGALILEGGCGLAVESWRLHRLGYCTLALDYALKTLRQVASQVPEVRPLAGDVGALPLADGSVDAYWSLGVIEHFYGGYGAIRDEMRRVVRPGGHLFLTFPSMSWLRRAKARLGLYPPWTPSEGRLERFYQFGLAADRVAEEFEASGFETVRTANYLGVSGLCEELGAFGRSLDRWLTGRARHRRLLRAALDALVRPVSHHIHLLVLRRSASSSGGAGATPPPPAGE